MKMATFLTVFKERNKECCSLFHIAAFDPFDPFESKMVKNSLPNQPVRIGIFEANGGNIEYSTKLLEPTL